MLALPTTESITTGTRGVERADPAQRLDAVDARHHHVEQDHVGRRAALEQRERAAAVLGGVDVVALELEQIREERADPLGVVDDEDAVARAASSRLTRRLWRSAARARRLGGQREREAAAAARALLDADLRRRAPRRCRRQIARPRPMPPRARPSPSCT